MISPRSRTFLLASILFFLSGMLGLGYELVWIRKAALVVGASQIALSTVLTSFFLGLGLGSYFVGSRWKSRRRSPLFVYGLFEVAIGVFALAFPALFPAIEALYSAIYPAVEGSSFGLFAVRFLLLFALFLVPTFFMGGTLPLLLDALVAEHATIGSRTSFLYGLNILGAVVGVLATSYFAIPWIGMDWTSRLFGLGNLVIGLVALLMFRGLAPIHADEVKDPIAAFFPAAAFVSGLLAIAYQIAWARYFSLFNTGTVYLTAVLLAVFLLALAAGSFVLSPLLKLRWHPLRIFCTVQAILPLFALHTLEWWRGAEYRFSIRGTVAPDGSLQAIDTLELSLPPDFPYHWRFATEALDATFFAPLFQVALVIFVPVMLLGMGLPCIIAAATRTSAGLRSASGRILLWNTLGSSAGSFIAGYVLLPLLGLHYSLLVFSLGSIGLALAAWWNAEPRGADTVQKGTRQKRRHHAVEGGRPVRLAGLVLPACGLLAAVFFAFRDDTTRRTIKFHGYGRDPDVGYHPDAKGGPKEGRMPLTEVIEGPLTTSFVFEDSESVRIGSGNVCLAVAYKDQPCSQAIQGHIPALFYPGSGTPRDCLGICLGSGQSFGALLLYPIERLDVVDISSEIVDLSLKRFEPYNHNLARDPRVKFHLDDGRHFVERAGDASYDVVSMEPPPPTAEGVYSLYSFEFYSEASRILQDGGIFMQWLPFYRVTPLDARGIIKTQAAVFPETFVVKVFGDDFMVVSFKTRPTIPLEAIRARVKVFETERLLKGVKWNRGCRHDIASLEGVLSFLIMGPEDIRKMGDAMIYHDDNQALSYSSGDRWLLRRYEGPALSGLSFAAIRPTRFEDLRAYFDPPLTPEIVDVLTAERTASLAGFNVPDPRKAAAEEESLRADGDPADLARRALNLAAAYDAALWKEEALGFVGEAVKHQEESRMIVAEEQLTVVRRIVRNRIVAYEPAISRSVAQLEAVYPTSPLVAAMRVELAAFLARERERKSGYWLE
ncbi:MAG TPA: hypothetical protein VMT52_17195 [Planctomycetota bacterium]|nr:hypothetical protein [Planctomycetota bacterium]